MATYKVTAVTWNGYTQGEEVTDPAVGQADLDVLLNIGVLSLVGAGTVVEPPVVTPPTEPETGDNPNGDLSQ